MGNKINREKISSLVVKSLICYFEDINLPINLNEGEQTKLFGGEGLLDSMGLVSFIVTVEEAIEDEFNISVVLADEKAMSRRTSPFSRISYLVDYIFEVLNKD